MRKRDRLCGQDISPKAQEVKYLYQDIRLIPDSKGISIENRRLFTDTFDLEFVYSVLKDGEPVYQKSFYASIKPLDTGYEAVPVPDFTEPGEYVRQVSALLKNDTLWADSGYETAFGEAVTVIEGQQEKCCEQPLTVVHGDVNIGVMGDGFRVLFSKQEGGIVSLVYDGKEWAGRPIMPVYWRATTDNDKGNRFSAASSVWYGAGRFPYYSNESCTVEEREGSIKVTYTYELSTVPKASTEVSYEVNGRGTVHVKAVFRGQKGLPQLPAFGMRLITPEAAKKNSPGMEEDLRKITATGMREQGWVYMKIRRIITFPVIWYLRSAATGPESAGLRYQTWRVIPSVFAQPVRSLMLPYFPIRRRNWKLLPTERSFRYQDTR